MKPEPDQHLVELAGAISDETPVDWSVALQDRPALAVKISNLEKVEQMATAFRKLQVSDAGIPEADQPLFTWGHLQVIEKIGEGSFGEVFRAYDPLLKRSVALKLRHLGPSHAQGSGHRFIEEARRLARIRHNNVVMVYGTDLHDERVGIWTELIAGTSLAERVKADGAFGANESVSIGVDLCRALAAVHAAGLVHGDVKAANVLRERGGRLVLTDFGAASDMGTAGESFGSPASLAPEVLNGDPPTQASDLYSLGVLLFHLLTYEYPVRASNPRELITAHQLGQRTSLRDLRPDLPDGLIQVVETALTPDPSQRFSSAGTMEQALTRVLRKASDDDRSDDRSTAARAAKHQRLSWRLITCAGVLAAAVCAAGALFFVGDRARTTPSPRTEPVQVERLSTNDTWNRQMSPTGNEAFEEDVLEEPSTMPRSRSQPSTAAPSTTAVRPLQIVADLFRTSGNDETVLSTGRTIRPGDQLHLEVSSTEEVYLYVVNEDREGNVFVLFPIEGLDIDNPVSAGRHRLPGRLQGAQQEWRVTSAGGNETFMVIASRSREQDLERRLDELGLTAGDGDRMRGIGGLSRSSEPPEETSLDPIFRSMHSRQQRDGSVWVLRYELRNPKTEAGPETL